jgi:predicted NUDIX family NTP pyrophosphohydrolase
MKKILEAMKVLGKNMNGEVITFDFDHTIVKSFLNKSANEEEIYQFGGVNKEIIKRIKSFKQAGKTVLIVTSRQNHLESGDNSVKSLLKRLKIDVDGVFYTNGEPKAQKLYELGSILHFDDDPEERDTIEAYKKTHRDFNITVKDPNELIKDINAVAKGVIITADGLVLCAQRSDSYEWDAPGGHLMDGEEANYAFWRETKEELGLEVTEVQFLDKTETTWKGVTKDTFYFVGKTDYTGEELEGIIDLQWEVSDYFCASYEEVMRKVSGNSTQHLTAVLQLIQQQQELLESRQPHSKNHRIKKKRMIGLGGSRTTGAKGLKRVKDFKRSKSAPAGFGVLEEDDGDKPKRKFKISIISDIEEKKKRKKRKKKRKSRRRRGSYWPYWGYSTNSSDSDGSDGAGDGGGGE